jgi:hypothetical protein
MMWGGAFPEPLTFSIRALRVLRRARRGLRRRARQPGARLRDARRAAARAAAGDQHPPSDQRGPAHRPGRSGWLARLSRRRWYGFVRMQAGWHASGASRAGPLITVSESSKRDICRDFRVPPERVRIIPLGVDTRVFRPREAARVPGRIVAVASADSAIKGVATLLRAVAKLATDRDVHLVVVGKPAPATERLAAQLSLADRVTFTHGLDDEAFSALLASAEVAVVPSLYEGFSLPAVEHMASGTPLVASRHRRAARGDRGRGRAGHAGRRRGTRGRAAAAARLPRRARRAGGPRAGAGSASGSPGRGGRGDRGAVPGRHTEADVLTVDFRRFPVRPGRPRARPGLRRRAARVRGVPARRERGRVRPGPSPSWAR